MEAPSRYSAVVRCCYLGMFIQAMVINLAPLLFIPLKTQYGLSFEQLGRLVLINFITQMLVDLACSAAVDRMGKIKALTVAAQVFACVGLWLFAGAPRLFPANPYAGLVAGTVVFSLGCGLLEVLISPIIHAVPSDKKAGDMAVLHAFYPIGKVAVIAVTALLLHVFGESRWPWIALGWSLVPLVNTVGFLAAKMPPFVHAAEREPARRMARTPVFWCAMAAIFCAGATEVTFAQWTSAFAQTALGLPQLAADWAGFGLFAAMMAAGRLWFGLRGHGTPLRPLLLAGAALSFAGYLAAALVPLPWLALAACAVSGLSVSMLWPGIVSASAARFPRAGISLFALLAAFGDTGAGLGPWLVGVAADAAGNAAQAGVNPWEVILPDAADPSRLGLRVGFLVGAAAPALLAVALLGIRTETPTKPSARVP